MIIILFEHYSFVSFIFYFYYCLCFFIILEYVYFNPSYCVWLHNSMPYKINLLELIEKRVIKECQLNYSIRLILMGW